MKLTGDSGTWRLGHRPALDGLRAIAVALVVFAHFKEGAATLAGEIGVTVFFTLSGFLITTLLLEERRRTGRIDRLAFYRRRALRLLPALAVMVAVVYALTLAGLPTDVSGGMVLAVAGYVSNWFLALASGGPGQWNALGHTWSLAIEEQFYILWPFVVALALRWGRRGVLMTAAVGAIASASWAVASDRSTLYTDVSAYGLLVGCALAAWMNGRPVRSWPAWVPAVAVAGIVGLVFLDIDAHQLAYLAVPLLTAAAIAVAAQVNVGWLAALPLVWLGQRSYGLYLWHVPIAWLAFHINTVPTVICTPVGILLSLALTELSWRYVETPFLRLKTKAHPEGQRIRNQAAAATTA